jgi:hypothetical protein
MGPAPQQGRLHAPQSCRDFLMVILLYFFRRNPKLRSCCLLICNVLANSPANKSLALKHGLFDVVYIDLFALQLLGTDLAVIFHLCWTEFSFSDLTVVSPR